MGVNDRKSIRISQGKHRGRVKNIEISWGRFAEKFRTPSVDQAHSYAEYMKMSPDEQGPLKAAPGYIVGAWFRDGVRRLTHMEKRYILSFDMDVLTPDQLDWILQGFSDLCDYEFIAHSTRKHCPEAPRLRVHVLLKRPVTHEEHNALSRILGSKVLATFEESMIAVDVVSHRAAQVSYMPSVSRNQEYIYERNEGKALDPDEFLAAWGGDWTDHTQLPMKPGENSAAADNPDRKAENPLQKPGLIGAFCNAYTVEEAMDEFLPGVYEPGESTDTLPRYSYLGGTTRNGAVVYEDGLFLQSWHSTDPAEGLHNAWDLVRLHKFSHLDAKAKEDTSPSQLPSFKAMEELALADPRVQEQRLASYGFDDDDESEETAEDAGDDEPESGSGNIADSFDDDYEADIDDFLGLGPEEGGKPEKKKAKEPKADKNAWMKDLTLDKQGNIERTKHNCSTIICNDPRIAPCISRNDLSGNPTLRKPLKFPKAKIIQAPVTDPITGRGWVDTDTAALARALSAPPKLGGYGIDFAQLEIQQAMLQVAEMNRFNPVLEKIAQTSWDGVSRVETFFIDYLGAADNAYHRELARVWFVAAVCRLYEPGHKFDLVPIIGGHQGIGKSGLIEIIGMGFAGMLAGDFGNTQKMVECLGGKWILEVPELKGFARGLIEDIKQFFSATSDTVRLAYRANPEDFPRRAVFIGTTNENHFLKDTTGNRRFAPVLAKLTEEDGVQFTRLKAEVGLVWAEAVEMYHAMRAEQPTDWLPLYLRSPEAKAEHKRLQEEVRETAIHEPVAEVIEEWLNTPVTPEEIGNKAARKFSDDDDGEVRFVRNLITATTIRMELAGNPVIRDLKLSPDKVIGNALQGLEGWEYLGNVRRLGKRARWYGRKEQDTDVEWIAADAILRAEDDDVDSMLS